MAGMENETLPLLGYAYPTVLCTLYHDHTEHTLHNYNHLTCMYLH